MQYYDKLKSAREDRDLSQSEVAEFLGTSQTQVSRHEQGKHEIPASQLKQYCLLYGVSADYVLGLPRGLSWPR